MQGEGSIIADILSIIADINLISFYLCSVIITDKMACLHWFPALHCSFVFFAGIVRVKSKRDGHTQLSVESKE